MQTIPTDARSLSRRRAAYSVAVAIVFLAYFGACLHGIANYWQWGHNGYNGAAFSNGARNSLRFGVVGQAIYYQGTEPPKAQHMATSHPQMLHYHLVGSYALFGFHEWAGRLVPAFYSVLTLALLFHLARRLWGPAVALVGITVYALTPMHLVFANMIDHEQGGIFWTLCLVWFYVCWFQSLRRRYLLLCLVAVTMAMQFDWPAYYVAFFVAVHALIAGLARRPGWLRWRPEYTFVVVFSIVVLANFGGFFAWIAATRGGLSEMVTSFRGRTGSPPDYASFVWMFTRDLHGYVAVGLLAAWLGVFVTRVVRRRAQVRDLVPCAFVFAQLISSLVFKDAGRVHSYWTYYLGPAIALGGADALVTFARLWVGAAKRWPKVPRFAPALMVLLVGAPLFAYQARFAWVQLGWGFAFGSGAYIQPYTDQFEEIMWVKEVAKRFDRTGVHYLLHPSIRSRRFEFDYYLDAPNSGKDELTFSGEDLRRARHPVFLFDLRGTQHSPGADGPIAWLARKYKTFVWDRRFVAVDGGSPGAGVHAFVSRAEPASVWWRWLVNPRRPPISWSPDPDVKAAQNLLGVHARPPAGMAGGSGGQPTTFRCPEGSILTGLAATHEHRRGAVLVRALRPTCRALRAGAGAAEVQGPPIGPPSSKVDSVLRCAGPVVGMFGRAGVFLDGIGLVCGRGDQRTAVAGGSGGAPFERRCPPDEIATGLLARSSSLIDAVGLVCGRAPK